MDSLQKTAVFYHWVDQAGSARRADRYGLVGTQRSMPIPSAHGTGHGWWAVLWSGPLTSGMGCVKAEFDISK